MHYVVCARYRDPVIRPSMDSMIFRNGAGGGEKKRPWTRPDSNDHTVGPCAFFFFCTARGIQCHEIRRSFGIKWSAIEL